MSDQRNLGASDPLVVALLGVGGLILGFSALCWVAALGTLLLTGHDTSAVAFDRSPRFVVRLLDGHDPGTAWSAAYPGAASLTGWLFWLMISALALAGLAGTVVVLRWTGGASSRRSDPATWATRRHERRLAVPRDPGQRRWRLVAGRGRASGRILAGHDCVSAVAFGPNGSGKTTSLIIPNVLDWDGPVVLTTAKSQDLAPLIRARAARGPVWVIAPGGAPGHETVGWSPIAAASDDDRADRLAEWMVESSGMTGDPKARPWNAQARKYLKGLLLAAHLSGGGLAQWVEWIHAGERARDHVEDILRVAGHEATAREYASTWQIHDEGKGSVLFTALGLADVYSRPGVADAAEGDSFTPTDLLDGSGTLCIVSPSAEGDRFAPYFTALVSAIVHTAESRAAKHGDPITPRLLLAWTRPATCSATPDSRTR